jgi:hypothetical protein
MRRLYRATKDTYNFIKNDVVEIVETNLKESENTHKLATFMTAKIYNIHRNDGVDKIELNPTKLKRFMDGLVKMSDEEIENVLKDERYAIS